MKSWFFHILQRAISRRMGRFLLASAAVLLAVTVITALLELSLGIRGMLGRELRSYGATMIVSDASGRPLTAAVAESIGGLSDAVTASSPQVYGTTPLGAMAVEVVGMEPGAMTGYRVRGALPRSSRELMVGANLADAVRAAPGGTVRLGKAGYRVSAVFEKGTDEDAAIVMPLEAARELLGISGASAVLLNADTRRMGEVEEKVLRAYPFLRVKTLRQVAVAEEQVLGKIQLLMLLVSVVVLAASGVALGSTMRAAVLERREEIGVMMSIGAKRSSIGRLFLAESVLAGVSGGLSGFCAGVVAAEAIARAAFHSFIAANVLLAPASVGLGIVFAVSATYFPVRDATGTVPARILRGE